MSTERLLFPSIWPRAWWWNLKSHPLRVAVLTFPLWSLFVLLYVLMWPVRVLKWLVNPIVERFVQSRFWKWLGSIQIPDPLELYKWDATEAFDLMMRIRKVRPLVLVLLAVEYAAAIMLGVGVGVGSLVDAPIWLKGAAWIALVTLVALCLPCMFVSSYFERLMACWISFKFTLCPVCAYIRDHSESRRCPECGSMAPPSAPGQMPPIWNVWSGLISPASAGLPIGLVGSVFAAWGFLHNSVGIGSQWLAAGVLGLTASLLFLVCRAIWLVWGKCRLARDLERVWRLSAEK
jgi:hypothetical protein